MRSLIIFLSLLFMCSPVFAKDKLTTLDKETLDEFNSQYYHLNNECAQHYVDAIAWFFYKSHEEGREWKSCGAALNDSQKLIWSGYWALYTWKVFKRETKIDACYFDDDFTYTDKRKEIFLTTLFRYTVVITNFDACSFNPTIKNAVGE